MNLFWNSVFGFVFLFLNVNYAANIQLEQNVKPKKYWINIKADLEKPTFQGSVMIELSVEKYIQKFTLHAKNLTVAEVTLFLQDGSKQSCIATMDGDNQLMEISFAETVGKGTHNLSINYEGKIQDDMNGFYRSYYFADGKKRWLGATQFESTSARKAFPCFDEPRFRADFDFTIAVPLGYKVISNTKLSSQHDLSGNWTQYNFATYPSMPTYLLGWIMYDPITFTSESLSKDGIDYKVWAQKKYSKQTSFALGMAPVLLKSLSNFTGLPYKIDGVLEKMDQIAVPDFDAGAMENWGLVTYRESGLLYHEKLTSTETKRNIMMVIAHEFTHQWFGNLNTLEWWSYVWLNEAFARYFQYFIPAKEFPEWKLDEQFVVNALQVALDYDSKPTHPMTSEITHHKNITAMFDMISYSKGASIVRMMEHTLTPVYFQKGLSHYLSVMSKRSDQVSSPEDLFNLVPSVLTVEERKQLKFEKVFKSWTENSGFPLITVTRNYTSGSVLVEQERFYYKPKKNDTTTWYVPLTYTVQNEINFNDITIDHWLTPDKTSITIDKIDGKGWVIFNIQHKGFYRVNYDEENWRKIIQQLKTEHSKICAVNRAQLIDDAFSLARAGKLNYSIAFEITTYLHKETDYVPWVAAIRNFNYILNHFHESPSQDKLPKYFLKLVNPIVDKVTFKETAAESVVTKLMRISLLTFAAKVGHSQSESNAIRIAKDLGSSTNTEFSADVQKALLCQGIRSTNSSIWHQLFNKLGSLESPTQMNDFIRALTCTHNPESINKYINETIAEGSVIRKQDSKTVFSGLSASSVGANTFIKFISQNYKDLIKFNNGKDDIVSDFVKYASGSIYKQDDLSKIKNLLQNMTSVLTESTIKSMNSSISKIEENFEWRSKNWDGILNWLREEEMVTVSPSPGTSQTTTVSPTDVTTTKKPGSSANSISSSSATLFMAGAVLITITSRL